MKSYVIWNNKGGIGKTMLSFLLSTEYALLHPDENIVVIDMCPQANVSQVILGGSDNINAFNEQAQKRHTVADYFINRYEKTPFQIMGIESEFYIQPKEFNDKLPDNLFLTVGSPKLEILNPIIDILTNNGQPVRIGGIDQWKAVYNWINDLKTGIINKIGENTIFFIDTNPSFANYTKIAILSADRLIVPCFSDIGSLLAIKNLIFFLYNINYENGFSDIPNNFYNQVKEHIMSIPLIYMLIMGRSTQYNNKAAAAFKYVEEQITDMISRLKTKHNGSIFSNSNFDTVRHLRDLNSVAPLINVRGELLSNLRGGQATGLQTDTGTQMMVPTNIQDFKNAINEIVELL